MAANEKGAVIKWIFGGDGWCQRKVIRILKLLISIYPHCHANMPALPCEYARTALRAYGFTRLHKGRTAVRLVH